MQLISSPPQITVFTLNVIHPLSIGTYNYKFYAYYWSLYKIQVLSWHVQWHHLYFNKMFILEKKLTYFVLMLCTFLEFFLIYTSLASLCLSQARTFISKGISIFFINTIMVYTYLINSMVTQLLLPIGYSYRSRFQYWKKYQYFITNKTDESLFC